MRVPFPACGERSARSCAPGEGASPRDHTDAYRAGAMPPRPSPRKRGEGEEALLVRHRALPYNAARSDRRIPLREYELRGGAAASGKHMAKKPEMTAER